MADAYEALIGQMMATGSRLLQEGDTSQDTDKISKAQRLLGFTEKLKQKRRENISNGLMITDLSARNSRVLQHAQNGRHGSALVELANLQSSYMPSNVRGSGHLNRFFQEMPQARQLINTAERYIQGMTPFETEDGTVVTGNNLMAKARDDFRIAEKLINNHTADDEKAVLSKMLGYEFQNGKLLNRRQTMVFHAQEEAFAEAMGAMERKRAYINERYSNEPPEVRDRMTMAAFEENLGDFPEMYRIGEEYTVDGGKVPTLSRRREIARIERMTRKDLNPAKGLAAELYRAALLEDAGIDEYKGSNLRLREKEVENQIDQAVMSGKVGPFDLYMIQETKRFQNRERPAFTPEGLEKEFANTLPPEQREKALKAIATRERLKKLETDVRLGNRAPDLEAKQVVEATSMVASGDRLAVIDSGTKLSPKVARSREAGMKYWLDKKEADEYYSGALESHGGLRPYARWFGSMVNMFHPDTPSPRNMTEAMLLTGGNPLSFLVSGSRGAVHELMNEGRKIHTDPEFKRGYQYLEYKDLISRGELEGEALDKARAFVNSYNSEISGIPGETNLEKELKDTQIEYQAMQQEMAPVFGSSMREKTPGEELSERYGFSFADASGSKLNAAARFEDQRLRSQASKVGLDAETATALGQGIKAGSISEEQFMATVSPQIGNEAAANLYLELSGQ